VKKILFLLVLLACIGGSQAYADYSFSFMSNNGQYGFTGTLYTASNGNGPLLVTGASLTGDGSSNNGTSYALLAPGLTAQNSDGAGANLSGADNLLSPGSTPVFNPADPTNGMIFVQTTNLPNNALVVNGSVNSSTNNVPAIGIWADNSNNYEYWQSYSSTGSGTGTVTLTQVVTATPLPAAAYLFGSGLMGLVGIRRKMKN